MICVDPQAAAPKIKKTPPPHKDVPIMQTGLANIKRLGSLLRHSDWKITATLGKIPKAGDITRINNLKFTVERVRKRRIETVILTFESIADNS